jgi:hypothetical protein
MKTIIDLKQYESPKFETSFYKGIPIEYKELVRKVLKSKGYKNFRFYLRGPRTHGTQSHCAAQDAISFAIYKRT